MTGVARQHVPFGLLPEALSVALWRGLGPLRVWWRRTWLYRRLLKGSLSDRIAFQPYDSLPRRLGDAEALLRGRFRFGGESVEVKDGSIFDKTPPTREWLEELHAFAWLPPLSAAGGDAARKLATNLISQWLRRNAKYSEPAWSAPVMARRLAHVLSHGRLVLSNSDIMWRSKVFVGLREQSRMLARIAREAPEGMPRLESAAVLALSGACLDNSGQRLAAGLKLLEEELGRQVLPDGGHVCRSPEALLHAYRLLTMVMDALGATSRDVPQSLRSAHDRIAPMLRFFRHGDGGLACFNGGRECDPRMLAGLLARDDVRGQPFAHAPHSGYQRLAAGRTLVVMDCGAPPPKGFSTHAHAGALSFELSTGAHRLIVNCGAASAAHAKWETALRATAAHSTLIVADCSSAAILPPGWIRNLLGPRLFEGPTRVETTRLETTSGARVEANHDGYASAFGLRHERQLALSVQGTTLAGLDRLVPTDAKKRSPRGGVPFAVRFHIHPDVRMSPSQGGDILLRLPSGEGWRFRVSGGSLATEESVYLGGDTVRRSEQLVVTSAVKDSAAEVAWVFEEIGAG